MNPTPTLTLTEEEAFALLDLCMLSPLKLDIDSERALKKLADFCKYTHYYERVKGNGEPPK